MGIKEPTGGGAVPEEAKGRRPNGSELHDGLAHFGELLDIKDLDQCLSELGVRREGETLRGKIVEFLTDQIGGSIARAPKAAQENLRIVAETLGNLPRGVTQFEKSRSKDRALVIITRMPEASAAERTGESIHLDINFGGENQQIRIGLRDAENNESLAIEIHHYSPRNSLQLEIHGKALGGGAVRHKSFPAECSDPKVFAQLQLALLTNLCPTTEGLVDTKESYLKQLLKEMGMVGERAAGRREVIDRIMARYPGTPQNKRAADERKKEEERGAEKARREEEKEPWLRKFDRCEPGLADLIQDDSDIRAAVEGVRRELEFDDSVPSEKVLLAYLTGSSPGQLCWGNTTEEERTSRTKFYDELGEAASIVPNLVDILQMTILRRSEAAGGRTDNVNLIKGVFGEIRGQIEMIRTLEPEI